MKESPNIIDEGYSLNYLIPAAFVFMGGGLTCLYLLPVGLGLIVCGILLISLKTGIELDFKNNKIRSYKSFFSLKTGEWISLKYYTSGKLCYVTRSKKKNEDGSSEKIRNKTYTIELLHQRGKKLPFHEFTSYKLAKQTKQILEEQLNIPVIDAIQESRKQAAGKRA
jgi:hypothetical protein